MLVAIDAGNSRIKWACRENESWTRHGVAAIDGDLGEMAKIAENCARAIVSCVASDPVRAKIATVLASCEAVWLSAKKKAAGVSNHYQPPESLGSDRWCALLGMRDQLEHGTVVLAGTAVTVDRLEPGGDFRGGLILPGRLLMAEALAKHTQLRPDEPAATDTASLNPDSTAAAVRSGCLRAVAGAIRIQRESWNALEEPLAVAGGDAEALAALLPDACLLPDLIFDGMLLANS